MELITQWITTEDTWLSEKQSLHNAQIVANHFVRKGWTPHAISALCGNMRHESSINPNIWEFGYGHSIERGYGLVQWTPASKYINWAIDNGLDWDFGNSQLDRIDYEQKEQIQWINTGDYPFSFNEFTRSTEGVAYLTQSFTWNYERPNREAGIESTPDRIAFAMKCLNELDWSGSGIPPIDDGSGSPGTPGTPSTPGKEESKTKIYHLYLSEVLRWR